MKETLSRVLHSSLEWDDSEHLRAVDKLTAFSFSERMATLLWRLKYGNDRSAYKPVVYLLARTLKPIAPSVAVKIAEQTVHEWLFAFCPACLGAKEVMAGDLRVVCSVCDGVGVARYSDSERNHRTGGRFTKQFEKLHHIISDSDLKPTKEMRKRLVK